MKKYNGVHLDKLQIASVRLADTIYGYFSGNHPASTIDNARAIVTVLKDVDRFLQKFLEYDPHPLATDEDGEKYENYIELKTRLLSNFAKHADKDPHHLAVYNDLYAYEALRQAVNIYRPLVDCYWDEGVIDFDNWTRTEYGDGPKIDSLCGVFQSIEEDHKWIITIALDEIHDCRESNWEQGIPDVEKKIGRIYIDSILHSNTKAKCLKIIRDNNLWPAEPNGGLGFYKNKYFEVQRPKDHQIPDNLTWKHLTKVLP